MSDILFGRLPLKYKCPACGNYYRSTSVLSSNSFDATKYTDGVIYGLMLHQDFWFTTCPKCKKTFDKKYLIKIYIKDKEQEKLYLLPEKIHYGWYDGEEYIFNAKVWENVIDAGLFFPNNCTTEEKLNATKKLYIGLWQAYNRLYDEKIQCTPMQYIKCCKTLINLINPSTDEDYLMLAELYRNIGKFKKSFEVLSSVQNKKANWKEISIKMAACLNKIKNILAIE